MHIHPRHHANDEHLRNTRNTSLKDAHSWDIRSAKNLGHTDISENSWGGYEKQINHYSDQNPTTNSRTASHQPHEYPETRLLTRQL